MMTRIRRSAWLLLLLAASSLLAQAPADQAQERVRCIVVLRQGELSDADAQRLGGTVEFRTARRLVLTLPRSAVDALRRNPNVKYIQESVLASESAAAAPLDAALAAEPQTPAPLAGSIPTWSSGDYQYDGAGNIYAIGTSAAPGSDGRISTYSYDVLGRLAGTTLVLPDRTASETYAYDVYGNLKAITPGGGQPFDVGVNSLNNKIAGEYDQAGNMVRWGTPRFVYDGANMVSSRTDEGGNVEYYVYTADDERIGVLRGQRWSWSVRGLDQKVLRRFESDEGLRTMDWLWVEDYVYRDGAVVATERMPEEGGRQHLHADHLGTTRLITGAGGALVSSHDYLPFGIELTSVNQHLAQGYALEEPSRFTGHERDFHGSATAQNENYLDYMHARFYNPKVGRFLSVDPVLNVERAKHKPQGWNRYAYVENNPLNATDPTGREIYLQVHYVVPYVGYHTSLRIEPVDQARYANDPDFQQFKNAQTGRSYMTLGAGKENGLLVSEPNRERDVKLDIKSSVMKLDLKGRDENKVIADLRAADGKYKDNLPYAAKPQGAYTREVFGVTVSSSPATYNSNSFIAGLLRAVGLIPPKIKEPVPGFERPVPVREFQ